VFGEWLRLIVSESKEINDSRADLWLEKAEERSRRHSETARLANFVVGELVLLHKHSYERGLGQILPQCDGPYEIVSVPTSHVCILADPLTGEPYDKAKPVSVTRLVHFEFPSKYAEPTVGDVARGDDLFDHLNVGALIAISRNERVYVARVERLFKGQRQLEVHVMEVPKTCRFGPWARRIWEVMSVGGSPVKEIILAAEVFCLVSLQNGALDQKSLEMLASFGLPTGAIPRRDKAIAGPTIS
jgi:hypothetical protein